MYIPATIYKKTWYDGLIREKGEPSEYTVKHPTDSPSNGQRIKLDQIMKVLFKLSDQATLHMINHLFDENFVTDNVTIHYVDPEFIDDEYGRIIGDLCLVIASETREYRYHIEFQTEYDSSMVIRMFRYGFEAAVNRGGAGDVEFNEIKIIDFPRQLVVYIEESNAISDKLSLGIRMPNEDIIPYSVPIMKYWEYTPEQLIEHNMFAMLPLQVFKFRKAIRAIDKSRKSDNEKSKLISQQFEQLKQTIRELADILAMLRDSDKILSNDLRRILDAISHINTYLYKSYGEYEKIEKEAVQMLKTLYDPYVFEQGIEQGIERGIEQGIEQGIQKGEQKKAVEIARNALSLGMDINMIAKATGLTEAQIEELK